MAGVIADASPLIALHQIGQISLIKRLFGPILIPSAVAREVSPSLPALPAWIMVRDLTQPLGSEILKASLGAGESQSLAFGLEIGASLVILDERPARKLALVLGLPVVGTAGILLACKARKPHSGGAAIAGCTDYAWLPWLRSEKALVSEDVDPVVVARGSPGFRDGSMGVRSEV